MILVVDDDATLTTLIAELLRAEGYEVRVCHEGGAAYEHVKNPKCKGVVLDLHMPGVNGPELLMIMESEGIRTPVIVVTSDPDFGEEEMKQFPNVRKLFHKPLYPEEILDAVRRFFEKPSARKAG